MTIEHRRNRVVVTACPFCETPIAPQQSLADHLPCDGTPSTDIEEDSA